MANEVHLPIDPDVFICGEEAEAHERVAENELSVDLTEEHAHNGHAGHSYHGTNGLATDKHGHDLTLKAHYKELVREVDEVARVESVPEREKEESRQLGYIFVTEPLESLETVPAQCESKNSTTPASKQSDT